MMMDYVLLIVKKREKRIFRVQKHFTLPFFLSILHFVLQSQNLQIDENFNIIANWMSNKIMLQI